MDLQLTILITLALIAMLLLSIHGIHRNCKLSSFSEVELRSEIERRIFARKMKEATANEVSAMFRGSRPTPPSGISSGVSPSSSPNVK